MASWHLARFSSSLVNAWKLRGSKLGACESAINAFVLHGFPTTITLHVGLATSFNALPCSAKMAPFMSSKSPRSIPGPRGLAPINSAQSASANTFLQSMPMSTSLNNGNKESSSSIATPSSAVLLRSLPSKRNTTG